VPEATHRLRAAGHPPWQADLLARRGVEDEEAAAAFLSPSMEQLHDPYLLHGFEAAVKRLVAAREAGERVAIVGDYDVDGVSSTALLVAVLQAVKVEVEAILPHRMREGYGFQPVHVERAREAGCALVLTLDCGTNAHEALGAARDAGLDVVVADHHLPDGRQHPDLVLVNPHQDGCSYPFPNLCAAGLAFKLSLAVAAACGREVNPGALLRIACLGTIADLVPLLDENRTIAALGLEELGRTRSPGLGALIEVAGLKRPYTTQDVGFGLGPRLNAPGRMDSATLALELLLCRDPGRAKELAGKLDEWNKERRGVERRTAEEARAAFARRDPLPPVLFAWDEGWHRGVVGIAAGRIAREHNRPVLLLALEGETATGSGRSAADIHLHDLLANRSELLEGFGGHAQAVGLTVHRDRLEPLREALEQDGAAFAERIGRRIYEYELELRPRDLDARFVRGLDRLEPHGMANPAPLLRILGPLRLAFPPRTFGHGHLSATAMDERGGRIRLIGWGWQARLVDLEGTFEALGHLERDRYSGGSRLRLVDARPWGTPGTAAPEDPPRDAEIAP
jgi:single-stranded-DNA-specific exonuclease